jgi:potassium/chloride transporter 9
MGEFATTFFSALMGVIGSAKSLQALARDNVFPGLSVFGQGSKRNDEPTVAILFTYVLSQLTLLMDINTIASFVTMTYLITFWVTNFACFLLEIGSAPNFRPTFKWVYILCVCVCGDYCADLRLILDFSLGGQRQ